MAVQHHLYDLCAKSVETYEYDPKHLSSVANTITNVLSDHQREVVVSLILHHAQLNGVLDTSGKNLPYKCKYITGTTGLILDVSQAPEDLLKIIAVYTMGLC